MRAATAISLPDARTNDVARGGELGDLGEGESRDLQDGRYDTELRGLTEEGEGNVGGLKVGPRLLSRVERHSQMALL